MLLKMKRTIRIHMTVATVVSISGVFFRLNQVEWLFLLFAYSACLLLS